MTGERIGLLIERLPQLHGLNRRLRRLVSLQSTLTEVLPGSLVASTTLTLSATGEVVLFVNNGATAAKLRHMAPRILVLFRQRAMEVTGIRVQVQVSIRHNLLPRKQISVGPQGRQALAHLAARLEESPLKSALERLSRRTGTYSDQPLQHK